MKLFIAIISFSLLLLFSCTDEGISKCSSDLNIYKVQDNYYLRKIVIEGDNIYLRCDEKGNPISSPIAVTYRSGKTTRYIGISSDTTY